MDMTYEEFLEKFKEKLQTELGYTHDKIEFLPEGYTSKDPKRLEWIIDSNMRYCGAEAPWLLTDFFLLTKDDRNPLNTTMVQRVAIRKMYEDALQNGFDAAFDQVRETEKKLDEAPPVSKGSLTKRSEGGYEGIQDQLILRPLNYGLHIQDLHNCVYKKFSDFVLVLYQLLGDADHSLMTSRIMRDELYRWHMEKQMDKVFQDAMENTLRLFPPVVYDKRVGKEVNFLEGDFKKEDIVFQEFPGIAKDMILLSTTKTTNGAIALFYPGVVEKLMTVMGGPFAAVFMNINDVMIFARNDTHADWAADTARRSGPMGEMLSGKKYLCDKSGIKPF